MDFMSRQTGQCNVKQQTERENCRGYTGRLSLHVGVITGNCWTKSQSLRYSSRLGTMVSNDWCIKHIYLELYVTCNWRKGVVR